MNGSHVPAERSLGMTGRILAVLTTLAVIGLSGCAIKPIPLTTDEVRSRAQEDRAVLTKDQEPISGAIDLYEAMARALKYNLDARVELMHKMLAQTQLNLSHYAMLPRLAANAGFDGRNNFSGGVGQSLISGAQNLTPFTSAEKNIFSADLSLSWNVLDFGLSYIRAKQAADDVLIAEEERRRVANRVMQDVRIAYWRAVSAERVLPSLKMLDEWVKNALEKAQAIQDEKLSTPLVPLQYRLDLLNTQRYVQQLFRELSTAKLQLAALINLPPGEEYKLMLLVPEREAGTLNLPVDMTVLEDRALEARPELRMIDYRRRINAREAKAAILEMIPSLNLQAGGNYSSNEFLFNQNWAAYAARASWNLLNIFRYPAREKTIEAQDQVLHTKNLALTNDNGSPISMNRKNDMTNDAKNQNRRVLVIDDNQAIHQDFRKILQTKSGSEGFDQARAALFGDTRLSEALERFDLDCADQGQAALTMVQLAQNEGRPYAVAFVDMRMPPGWDGLETIEHLWEVDAELQVVICTAFSDHPWEEITKRIGQNDKMLILQKPFNSIEMLQLATALCRKWDLAHEVAGQLDELNRQVEKRTAELQGANEQLTHTNADLVRTVADLEVAQAEILRQNDALERLASRDPLTGCFNRRAFYTQFETAFVESREHDMELCCLMVDIDHFKRINDQFGHAVGDQAIQAVAGCLSAELRLTDTVGRYGGEEFCLMFPRTTLAEAPDLAERLRIQVEAEAGGRVRTASCLVITVSCGISSTALGAKTPLELIDQADKALYAAKEGGRNCVMVLDPIIAGANASDQCEPQVRRITPRVSPSPMSR